MLFAGFVSETVLWNDAVSLTSIPSALWIFTSTSRKPPTGITAPVNVQLMSALDTGPIGVGVQVAPGIVVIPPAGIENNPLLTR
jgi:hypothetical protein